MPTPAPTTTENPVPHSILHRWLEPLCRAFALTGGMVLLGLIAMSLISITGRKLFAAPIRGDMELVEMGAAVAIAAFLPLCELRGLHLKADAFTLWATAKLKRALDIFAHALLLLATGVLTWRTALQVLSYREYGDTSTLLSVPMWLPLACIVPSLMLLALCALARVLDLIAARAEGAA